MFDVKESGRFIAFCRQEKGLTQKQLGDLIGVTDKAVSKWETGRSFPDASLIEPLCAVVVVAERMIMAYVRRKKHKNS